MRARIVLAFALGALPTMLVLAACGVDGATPDCSQPDSKCEPAAPNANPDARPDVKADSAADAPRIDTGVDAADAGDATDSDAGDAKADADAKPG